jgi:ABC-2 type transport system permease protein
VLYFGLPLAWTLLGRIPALENAARWLDGSRSTTPMTEHVMSATERARVGATLTVWMVLPLTVGLWRVTRGDVR